MTSVLITLAIYGSLAIAANVFLALWLAERERREDAERHSRIAQKMAAEAVQAKRTAEFERDNAMHTVLSQFGELNRVNARNAELQRIVDGKQPVRWILTGWSAEN